MNLEDELKDKFEYKYVKLINLTLGGCINQGFVYQCDDEKVFLKQNDDINASDIFEGEYFSLNEIKKTQTIRVPSPKGLMYINSDQTLCVAIVMEYIEGIKKLSKFQGEAGSKLAQLHLDNVKKEKADLKKQNWIGKAGKEQFVSQFGFERTTFCGLTHLDNEWKDDWVCFYAQQRLEPLVRKVQENFGSRELTEQWSQLQLTIPKFFAKFQERDVQIKPCLLHGDLWSGNIGQTETEVVTYDPASFYGHSEFDLAISLMFGGFNREFFNQYHQLMPKFVDFDLRMDLYKAFHYLNHWHHFGNGYKSQTLSIFKSLNKSI